MNVFDSSEYVRSRNAYMWQCSVEYFIALLVTDAFLAKLLTSLGICDSLIGVISSFITLAFVMQLLSIFLLKIKMSTKYLVMIFDTVSIFFFMLVYLTPVINFGHTAKTAFVMLCVFIAYTCKYLVLSVIFKWGNSFVDPQKRARFSANKETISLFGGMIFTAIAGYIIDRYEGLDNLNGGFLFIATTLLILNICNFICFSMMKKEPFEDITKTGASVGEIMVKLMSNHKFRQVMVLTGLFEAGKYFTIGFLGTYKTKELMFSAFAIQIINIAANGVRMLVSRPLGAYSDRHSFASGFRVGLVIAAAAFFVNIFTTDTTRFLIIIYTILYSSSVAGTNQNSFNIIYSYVESEYISQAMAIKNCLGGIIGFGVSVVAGNILSSVQKNGNMIFGVHIYGQQLLSAFSFAILCIAVVYINKTLLKENR